MKLVSFLLAGLVAAPSSVTLAQKPERGRDLGIPFEGTPGPLDAITDVGGVEVGHRTLVEGNGKLVVGKGPVRTGVTAIFPRGKDSDDPVFAGWFTMNGNGEMTGTTWVEESGFLWGPVMITNTHAVGVVRDAVNEWVVRRGRMRGDEWSLPVVAETWDGGLNDINGFHVTKQDAWAAMDSARGGSVMEGSVGGGTGMVCNQFKGGIGTASRRLDPHDGGYTVGVLVQCNYGRRRYLRIAGAPVGQEIADLVPCRVPCSGPRSGMAPAIPPDVGSIIIVVATDAPLVPHQLKRVARRAALGVGRLGGVASNSSGDIFIAFSTANARASRDSGLAQVSMVSNEQITPLFEATVQATEEAIVNAMLAARTMIGADDLTVSALPHERHRGGPLAMKDGNADMLICKYHGWTYRLDGMLRGVPHFNRVELFDKRDYGLTPVHLAEWEGLVFVSLAERPKPLETYLKDIRERVAPTHIGKLTFARRVDYDVRANWKVYVDNYLEGYHVPYVHPELYSLYDYEGYVTEVHDWYSVQVGPLTGDSNVYTAGGGEALYYQVFPNLMLNFVPGRLQSNLVIPVAPDRCKVIFRYYYDDVASAAARGRIEADIAFSDKVQHEDAEICERVQQGLGSRAYDKGRFSVRFEEGVYHFQKLLKQAYRTWLKR